MRKFFIIIILFFPLASFAGELDGKGLVCGPVGYYFHDDLHTFHHERNGKLVIVDAGEYSTNPKKIYINWNGKRTAIHRDDPKIEYEYNNYYCKLAVGYPSFYEMLETNLENIKENNKI